MPPDLAPSMPAWLPTPGSAREASEANNTAMAKVLAALKTAGIDARDIQTSRLSLQPQYAPNRSGPSPITGYRASNRVTVRIRDVGKVAGVIDTLVGSGANDIGNISFEVSQESKLLDEAREKAVADARRKAEIYARAAGVTLGDAPEHFRGRRAASDIPRQDDAGRADGRCAHADRAGRRDAVGVGQRDLGDQVLAMRSFPRRREPIATGLDLAKISLPIP